MTDLLEKLCAPLARDHDAGARRAAEQQLQRLGLPGNRTEAWKYTLLRPLAGMEFGAGARIPESALKQLATEHAATHDNCGVVVVAAEQCLLLNTPAWVRSFPELLANDPGLADTMLHPDAQVREHDSDSFIWMNLARCNNGVLIEIPASEQVSAPLHIIYADAAAAAQAPAEATVNYSRVHIHCRQGAAVSLVEHCLHAGSSMANIYRSIELDNHARLDLLQLRAGGDAAVIIEHTQVQQQADSNCRIWSMHCGGRLLRQEVRCALQGAAAGFAYHGLLLGHGRRHMDEHVVARHVAGDCHSRQLFRSVLAGRSRGVVNTAAVVGKGADGSDVKQHCAGILLSANAEMDIQPQLEIHADEVLASHGATVGQLDDDALFYMCSRGLAEDLARSMLLRGFVQTVLDELPEQLQLEALASAIQRQLELMS